MKRFLCIGMIGFMLAGCTGGTADKEAESTSETTSVFEETSSSGSTVNETAGEEKSETTAPKNETETGGELSICDKIYNKCVESGAMEELVKHDSDYLYNYFGIDTGSLQGYAAGEAADAALADMLIVLKAVSEDQTDEMYSLIAEYRESKLRELENYDPKEYGKVEASQIYIRNNYVYYVVSDNANDVIKTIEGMI